MHALWRFVVGRGVLALFSAALIALAVPAAAHDARPAYLEIRQTTPERYDVLWRTPVLAGMPLPVVLKLPDGTNDIVPPHTQELSDSQVERRVIEAPGGLAGRRIEFTGLQGTITDVLVRVELADGDMTTTLVRSSQPWIEISAIPEGPLAIAGAFVRHGIEHILLGYDHLLFVFALLLIVPSTCALVWSITAFTLAHSITLALATLGVVHVPGPPVEAAIAFSVLLLASEIVRTRRGEPSLTARWPWVIAFCFGLLHGFGFAGALSEIGLPRGDIPLALLAFNVGVELGQLAFIGAVLGTMWVAKRSGISALVERRIVQAVPYAIGALAGFWFVGRVAAFWG
ncbi:HupE/UreJ family protein [Variovorax sp. J22P168]|uniref:HupE/UreJ family protein n=1 Tax=Variovorax jilinensis TaxID=3053513 RepID=UPI00257893B5|nr:HupE/UreJ family protein [Variovorax sp. J22P168]MDM0015941.1 HupE/UreJ family protein [Variovorax sp. J22P168]